jgi:hypothetical protein
MKQVTLIQCTDTKRDGTHKARDLYAPSDYFDAMRSWAEARGDPWFILSAKHGLTHPDSELEDYDEYGLSEEQARDIAAALNSRGYDTVHITAGKKYTNDLIPELEKRGIDVVNHFAGERIGTRKKHLRQATARMEHDTLC